MKTSYFFAMQCALLILVSMLGKLNLLTTNRPGNLTRREVEVLGLVAEGLTNAQIAGRLFLSHNTVHAHVHSIYGKLDVETRVAAARFAFEHKLA